MTGRTGKADADFLVGPTQTYDDHSYGTLAQPIALPIGATSLLLRVTGDVVTHVGGPAYSPDGLDSRGHAEYSTLNTSFGKAPTYHGTSIGRTTGSDPALFGIFFNPGYKGTAPNSAGYRSGSKPDFQGLASYSPALNQPFFIGDGFTGNDRYGQPVSGIQQVFTIPAGATELLLGLGADPKVFDNSGPGYTVRITANTITANTPSVPEPATLAGAGMATLLSLVIAWRRRRRTIV